MKRKTDNFNKFYNKKRNSAIKEEFRQEKKAGKKARKEGIERHFEERRKARGFSPDDAPARKPPHSPNEARPPKGAQNKSFPSKGPHAPNEARAPKNPIPKTVHTGPAPTGGDHLPLNKYIAHGGICSRRDAADLIRQGKVTVNGKPITEPGTKVLPTDLVKVNGKKITISRNFVYILLNKPKDYITTTDDPQGRRTVLDLIRAATTERVYPIGRLDRNTSGVLLLTNDGDLSQKLAHPSHEIKKIYHVVLDKPLTKTDFDLIISGGVTLEDGPAHVDAMAYADPKDKTQIGLEIHSGRNRIVRRIFEHLKYDVRGLDRVMYAGLTKKNVQRGMWRLLSEKEIRILKYLNSSIKGSAARAKEWSATPPAPDAAPVKSTISHNHAKTDRKSGKPNPAKNDQPDTPSKSANPRPSAPRSAKSRSASPRSGKPHSASPRSGKPHSASPRSGKPTRSADGRPRKPRPTTPRPRKPKSRDAE